MSNKLLIIIQENIRDKKMNKDCFNKIYIIFISIGFIKNVIPIIHYVQNKIIARVLTMVFCKRL